jgi:hypothetical protein
VDSLFGFFPHALANFFVQVFHVVFGNDQVDSMKQLVLGSGSLADDSCRWPRGVTGILGDKFG